MVPQPVNLWCGKWLSEFGRQTPQVILVLAGESLSIKYSGSDTGNSDSDSIIQSDDDPINFATEQLPRQRHPDSAAAAALLEPQCIGHLVKYGPGNMIVMHSTTLNDENRLGDHKKHWQTLRSLRLIGLCGRLTHCVF